MIYCSTATAHFCLMNTLKMRLTVSPMLGRATNLTMILIAILVTSATSLSEKFLKDNLNNDANSLVSDLQNEKRNIFAVGPVNGKMTLFITGPGGKSDVSGGCTVQVDENNDGIFKITNAPAKMPNGVTSADVIFVCADSSGSKLMMMTSNSVDAVNLPNEGSVTTKIKKDYAIGTCLDDKSIHLPSSESLHYYTVSSSGAVKIFKFDSTDIEHSDACAPEGAASKLCTSDTQITIKNGCSGSPISDLVSGYVTKSTAYFFASDNTVYVFDASAFTSGQPAKLKKVASKDAWKSLPKPNPSPDNDGGKSVTHIPSIWSTIEYVVMVILILCFYCVLGFIYWWCEREKANKKEQKKMGGKGRRGSGSYGGHSRGKDKKRGSSNSGGGSSKSSKRNSKKKSSKGGASKSGRSNSKPHSGRAGTSSSKQQVSSAKGIKLASVRPGPKSSPAPAKSSSKR